MNSIKDYSRCFAEKIYPEEISVEKLKNCINLNIINMKEKMNTLP
jgi:hypothetical protein